MSGIQSETLSKKIYENLPSLGAVIIIFVCMLNFFIAGGFPLSLKTQLWVGFTVPFAVMVGSIFLSLTHIRHIVRRDRAWWNSVILLAFFFGFLIFGTTQGQTNPWYTFVYAIVGQGGPGGIYCMSAVVIIFGYFRMYRAKSLLKLIMIIVGLLTVGYQTGVIAMFAPWLAPVFVWSQVYLVGQVEFAVWMAYYIGMLALMVRILLLQEKLRPK